MLTQSVAVSRALDSARRPAPFALQVEPEVRLLARGQAHELEADEVAPALQARSVQRRVDDAPLERELLSRDLDVDVDDGAAVEGRRRQHEATTEAEVHDSDRPVGPRDHAAREL